MNKLIIRRLDAAKMFGVSRSTFDDWQRPDSKQFKPDFPKKIKLGPNTVGYLKSELDAYIEKLADLRG